MSELPVSKDVLPFRNEREPTVAAFANAAGMYQCVRAHWWAVLALR